MSAWDELSDYEVWGQLGAGGMSDVWLAKHVGLAVPVIIKTPRLSQAFESTESGVALRVQREARLMARVTSSRVVRAIDVGTSRGVPYLVQEYVDGIDLAELDRRRRLALGVGLPLWFVCHAMREVCLGLHAAHQAGVIHRDVKPSNVFGAPEQGIRLGDFGIAVGIAERARENAGTVRFMAPEQLRGESVGRSADVYGAGATACDLRYGRPPFERFEDALAPSLVATFPTAHSAAEAYFQHVLQMMLAKDAHARASNLLEPARHFATLARALLPGSAAGAATFVDRNTLRLGACTVTLEAGNIADVTADAIVSSANYQMKMRSGVGEALRAKGGDAIEAEAMREGERPLGSAVATSAGDLAARHVIHAVSAWNEVSCVGRATIRALLLSDELGHATLAMPALGTGAANVSMEMCASAMMTALRWHLALGGSRLRSVRVVLADEGRLRTFRDVTHEALRTHGPESAAADVGLAAEEVAVRPDAATHLDARTRSRETR
jgi:serine/threonine-protein kinase